MTSEQAIVEHLASLFVKKFHIEVPSPEIDLLESGILDSFQFVELLLQLEQHFNLRVRIETIELDDLRSLSRIARLVATNGGAAEPSPLPASAGLHG